jgi:hypothetical protein
MRSGEENLGRSLHIQIGSVGQSGACEDGIVEQAHLV